jgi:WD40 repeat protein
VDPWAIDVSPTSGIVAIGYCEHFIGYPGHGRAELVVWDPDRDAVVFSTGNVRDKILDLKFSPDGKILAVGTYDEHVRLFDTSTWQELTSLSPHSAGVFRLAFSRDGTQLASSSGIYGRQFMLGEIKVWNTADWHLRSTYYGHSEKVFGLCFLPDNRTLVSASDDSTLALWDTANPERRIPMHSVLAHAGMVYSVDVSPDGQVVATAGADNTARLWSTSGLSSAPEVPTQWDDFDKGLVDLAFGYPEFDPNGRWLALKNDLGIAILDAKDGSPLRDVTLDGIDVLRICFSRDSRWMACVGIGPTQVFDTKDWQRAAIVDSDAFYTWGVDFSPDSTHLATGGADGIIKIWSLSSGKEVARCVGHSDHISSIAYSPDGRRLVSASKDRTVRIFDPASAECLLTLTEHAGWVLRAVWSPDGKAIASCSEDLRVIIRRTEP